MQNRSATENARRRLQRYLEFKGVSQSAFERECGFSHGYVSNMRRAPSQAACSLIARRYGDLNLQWLLSGEGEMLTSEASPNSVTESERTRYEEMIKSRDIRIMELERLVLEQQRKIDKAENKPSDSL